MPMTAETSLKSNAITEWFESMGWEAFEFQKQCWQDYQAGQSGLIHAPTGLGKTFAAFGGPVLEALSEEEPERQQLQVLWVTPLRALANDTADALQRMLQAVGLNWEVGIRHGDISSAQRSQQKKQLPEVLIITPESLSLLLSYPESTIKFKQLRCIICDEWHELMGTKRGVQTELAIARLRSIAPQARSWALSATIANLEDAIRVLLGTDWKAGKLIQGKLPKRIEVETLMPEEIENFPWAGHLGIKLVHTVIERIKSARTTLVFTNTRSQTELWYQSLIKTAPELADQVNVHHGSLDRDLRREVEARLDSGEIRAVVCTSSLDLGVDFTTVEQVIQIGSPKGIARLTQRAGRSGHQPGATSKILGVPTNALEILEFAAAREAVRLGEIEARLPIRNALDVLVQHVITMALSTQLTEDALKQEVMSTYAFAEMSETDWQWVIDFAAGKVGALSAYPEYHKVQIARNGQLDVPNSTLARMHRMSIGTITSDSEIQVKYQKGGSLGQIEERFVSRLKPGDQFHFAGKRLELVRFRGMTAYVRKARSRAGNTPTWAGGRAPLSSELANAVSREIHYLREHPEQPRSREVKRLKPLLDIQQKRSELPGTTELLIEFCQIKRTWNAFVFPFAGRMVHEGLAALSAFRLSRETPLTLKTTINDYGFSLQSTRPFSLTDEDMRSVLTFENLTADLLECMNATELARRQFREISRVAGLVFQGYPGQQKSAKSLQMSSGLLYDVLVKYDPENRLVEQAKLELLERQLEQTRLQAALRDIASKPIKILETKRLSPFAFPLWAESLHQQVSSESWSQRVATLAAEQAKE